MRRTLIAATAAALTLTITNSAHGAPLSPTPASAPTPPPAGAFVPAPAPPAKAPSNPGPSPLGDAVSAYAKQYGVSREHALAVLLAQSRGVHLEEELREALGDGFGGLEFDQASARFEVWLAPGGSQQDAGRVLERHGLGNARLASTRWSAVERERAVGRLSEELRAELADGDVSVTSTPEDGVVVHRHAALSAAERDRLASAARATSGDAEVRADVEPAPARLEAQGNCNDIYCDPPLIAGVQYGPVGCTTSFSAAAGGGTYQLTAGHCVSVPNWPSPGRMNWTCSVYYGCPNIGPDIGGYANANGDAGLMRASGYWANYPAVRVHGWSYGAYAVTSTSNAWVGRYLCHTGSATKTHCGTVTTVTGGGAYGGSSMVQVVGACNAGGDSGGPWFDPSTMSAVGIHTAGDAKGTCGATTSAFEPVTRAVATLGVAVQHI